jgi:hypothetical protein
VTSHAKGRRRRIKTKCLVLRLPAVLPDLRRKNRCDHKPWVDGCPGDDAVRATRPGMTIDEFRAWLDTKLPLEHFSRVESSGKGERYRMPNPGLDPSRMALESAYTEAEAAQEVLEAAQACLEGRCCGAPVDFDDPEPTEHGCTDVYSAISNWQKYRGVK